MADIIEIKSRSTISITKDLYKSLEANGEFARLVETGILSLLRSKKIPYGITAGPMIGDAAISEAILIRIVEKEPNSLKGLLPWSVPSKFREVELSSTGSENGTTLAIFAQHFIEVLSAYVRSGRARQYKSVTRQSVKPRGKINLRASLLLRARGHAPKLVTKSTELTPDTLENQLVSFALKRVIRLLKTEGQSKILITALQYYHIFSDVGDENLRSASFIQKKALLISVIENLPAGSELSVVLAFAQPFVLDGGIGGDDAEFSLPRSYFLNLETLFEGAVRRIISEETSIYKFVSMKGSSLSEKIFVDRQNGFIADPDIVITHDKEVLLVVDCKYKTLEAEPKHQDVYQIMTHARAMNCAIAALIYPGEEFKTRRVGITGDGSSLEVVTVRPGCITEDLQAYVKNTIGLNKISEL